MKTFLVPLKSYKDSFSATLVYLNMKTISTHYDR